MLYVYGIAFVYIYLWMFVFEYLHVHNEICIDSLQTLIMCILYV